MPRPHPRIRARIAAALAWAFALVLLSFPVFACSGLSVHSAQAHALAATRQVATTQVPSARAQLAHEPAPRARVPATSASEPGLGGDRRGAAETRGGSPRNDLCARPVRVVDERQHATELEYDLAGQLVARKGHIGSEDAFAYSLLGDLVAAKSSSAEVTFERDALGRIVREQQTIAGETHDVAIAYDGNGQRIGRKTSLGHVEQVLRDAMGNRTRSDLDGHVVEHTADLLGRDVRRELAAGGAIESAFDPMGRLAQRRALKPVGATGPKAGEPTWVGAGRGDVTVQKDFRYSWDGELIEATDKDRGSTEYRYDPVGQLLAMVPAAAQSALAGGISSPGGQAAELFRYDPTGNIYEDGAGAETRVYGKGNRLLRKGNTDYEWDPDGNLIAKHTRDPDKGIDELWRYEWNDAGLMAAATGPELHLEFAYDSFARRLEKRVYTRGATKIAGVPAPKRGALLRRTRFVWDGDVLVHELREEIVAAAEASGDPVVEERTYWFEDGGFEPWAHRERRRDDVGRERGGWFHYVNDPIGTPERLVDETGEVAAEYRRKAWGEMEALPGARATTPVRLQGQYADEETGLSYHRWRYYGGALFVSADPLGLEAGLCGFAFAPNPFAWLDPLGLALRAATRVPGGVEAGRRLTQREALARLRNADPNRRDVIADSASEARDLAKTARRSCQPMHHDPHPAAGPGGLPHYHPGDHAEGYGHIFYPAE